MEFERLEEINNLVFYLWEVAVLQCLHARGEAMRYSDIGAAVDQWSRRRPSDSDLTRSLDRLRNRGFIQRTEGHSRRTRIYTLTVRGSQRAARIDALIRALDASEPDDVPPGADQRPEPRAR